MKTVENRSSETPANQLAARLWELVLDQMAALPVMTQISVMRYAISDHRFQELVREHNLEEAWHRFCAEEALKAGIAPDPLTQSNEAYTGSRSIGR